MKNCEVERKEGDPRSNQSCQKLDRALMNSQYEYNVYFGSWLNYVFDEIMFFVKFHQGF